MCRRPRHWLWRSVGNMQHGGHSELGELVNNSHQSISQSFVEGRSSSAGRRNEGWRSEGDPSSPTWCLKHAAWMHRRMHARARARARPQTQRMYTHRYLQKGCRMRHAAEGREACGWSGRCQGIVPYIGLPVIPRTVTVQAPRSPVTVQPLR